MLVYTLCDWRLALAAWAYENSHKEIMSDMEYDRLSEDAVVRGTDLPGFLPYTGQWVKGMDQSQLQLLYFTAQGYNQGRSDLHHPAIRRALIDMLIPYSCCTGYCHES